MYIDNYMDSYTIKLLTILTFFCICYTLFWSKYNVNLPDNFTQKREYTIRVNTFRRLDLLEKFLDHYQTCPDAKYITIVWSDQLNSPPYDMISRFAANNPDELNLNNELNTNKNLKVITKSGQIIEYEVHKTNSLSNRFKALSKVNTEAVLSIDDDLIISCNTLNRAVGVWNSNKKYLL